MPPANRDASELTRRRKAMALYAFQQANSSAVVAGRSVLREQAQFSTLDIVTLRKQGGCFCAAQGTYDFNGGGACGCRG
jgi:hypothetical protein